MTLHQQPTKIALVGDYPPRQCGIATFSHDSCQALLRHQSDVECLVVTVNDTPKGYDYPPEVRFEITEADLKCYRRAADFLNFSNAEVIYLQHEFGLYGGPAGSHILTLLREVKVPVVTHLHTILEQPDANQRRVMEALNRLSARFITMTKRGRRMLENIYEIEPDRIDLVPHGIPDTPFVDPNFYKDRFGVEGRPVLLTFGLLSPGKGIEYVLRALPEVVRQVPDLVYIILGATHPNLVREHGETYRLSLERLVTELGIKQHVAFYNRFVTLPELTKFLSMAEVYITPYLNPAQVTSGTLAYAFGCGKAVISTPYWHAEELLADGRGVLVPFRDSAAIARELVGLLKDHGRRHAMRKQAYLLGREMIWSQVAHQLMESFQRARQTRLAQVASRYALKTQAQERHKLPELRLDQLRRLSDSCGIFQHANFSVPNWSEGYCTDDNARALLLTITLEGGADDTPELQLMATAYAAFLNHAFVPQTGRFHNFMRFDRRWLDERGSDDCLGQALWALGACVGRSRRTGFRQWAAELFDRALPSMTDTTSPRAWAFAVVGIHEYFRRLSGDRLANQMRDTLTERLLKRYRQGQHPDWPWFEDGLTYANARLPHALILSGRWSNHTDAFETGLHALRWLMEVQTSEDGKFRPIGSNGFYPRGGVRAQFDQQPIEAYTSVAACIEAYYATEDESWMNEARKAFEWFLGGNDLAQLLYDPSSGGCFDALHMDRVNLNQGAESTLSFLLALQEMRQVETALGAFDRPVDTSRPPDSAAKGVDGGPSAGGRLNPAT